MTMKNAVIVALCAAMLTGCVQNYASREIAQGAAAGSLTVANAPLMHVCWSMGAILGLWRNLRVGPLSRRDAMTSSFNMRADACTRRP